MYEGTRCIHLGGESTLPQGTGLTALSGWRDVHWLPNLVVSEACQPTTGDSG